MKDSFDEKEVDEQEDIINVIEKKPIYKKWWFWVLVVFLGFLIFNLLFLIFYWNLTIAEVITGFGIYIVGALMQLLAASPVLIILGLLIYMLINYKKQVFRKWLFWVLLLLMGIAIWFVMNLRIY